MQKITMSVLLMLLIFLVAAPQARAQQATDTAASFFPRQGYMVSGYGGAGYNVIFADGQQPNNFSALFAPIMLFQISDRFLFEGEFEFEVEDGVSMTSLEYAQVDVSLNNNFTLVAGKFLLPFANFSERFHPTWINRLASAPAVYGSHGSVGPADPMLPILSDIGVQLRGAFPLSPYASVTAEAFVTQGPVLGAEEEAPHSDVAVTKGLQAGTLGGGDEPGAVGFGGNVVDNNENKMVGGRIGYSYAPFFEANISGMTGAYDAEGELNFSAVGLHLEGRYKAFTLHSEVIQTWQDLAEAHDEAGVSKRSAPANEGAIETLARSGYWVQGAYRRGKWQPVVRWSQLFESDLDGTTVFHGGRQLALGLDYWIEPSLVVKAEYLVNDEDEPIDNNRFALQLAFGF